jgi:hypothetical protein
LVSPSLPWAVNVVTFARGTEAASENVTSSEILGSMNAKKLTLPSVSAGGYGDMVFVNEGPRVSMQSATALTIADGTVTSPAGVITGIQALGFMVRTFQNGFITCGGVTCQANYGGSFPHVGRASSVQ